MDIDAIRTAWLRGHSSSLRRRRVVAALSAVGLLDFTLISLRQLGVIRHLPDPPGRIFDSDRVNSSRKAFRFGLPDGPMGATYYGLVLMLLTAGGTRRTGRAPLLDLLLGGAVLAGIGSAIDYLRDMIFVEKRACPYCILGAGLNLAMAPLVLPEVRGALAHGREARL